MVEPPVSSHRRSASNTFRHAPILNLNRVLGAVDDAAQQSAALQSNAQHVVRVGAIGGAVGGLLAPVPPALARRHPDPLVQLIEADAPQLDQLVARQEIDVALCRTPAQTPQGWTFEPLLPDHCFQVLKAGFERGAFIGASGDGRIASAARADDAEAAAVVLTGAIVDACTCELAGDEAYTLSGLAAMASQAAGHPLVEQDLPPTALERALVAAGLPPGFAAVLPSAEVRASRGGLFDDSRTLSRLIGRPTTPMREALAHAFARRPA